MRTKTKPQPAPAPAPAPMKRANFFMPQETLQGLDELAERKGITAAEVLRQAARTHLRRNGISV